MGRNSKLTVRAQRKYAHKAYIHNAPYRSEAEPPEPEQATLITQPVNPVLKKARKPVNDLLDQVAFQNIHEHLEEKNKLKDVRVVLNRLKPGEAEIVPAPQLAPLPAPQPAPKPASKPAPKPALKPTPPPAPKPVPKPASKPAPKPVSKPAPKPASKPAPKPALKPVPNPERRQPSTKQTHGKIHTKKRKSSTSVIISNLNRLNLRNRTIARTWVRQENAKQAMLLAKANRGPCLRRVSETSNDDNKPLTYFAKTKNKKPGPATRKSQRKVAKAAEKKKNQGKKPSKPGAVPNSNNLAETVIICEPSGSSQNATVLPLTTPPEKRITKLLNAPHSPDIIQLERECSGIIDDTPMQSELEFQDHSQPNSLADFVIKLFNNNKGEMIAQDEGNEFHNSLMRVQEWLVSNNVEKNQTDPQFKVPSRPRWRPARVPSITSTTSLIPAKLTLKEMSLRSRCLAWSYKALSDVFEKKHLIKRFCGDCTRCRLMFKHEVIQNTAFNSAQSSSASVTEISDVYEFTSGRDDAPSTLPYRGSNNWIFCQISTGTDHIEKLKKIMTDKGKKILKAATIIKRQVEANGPLLQKEHSILAQAIGILNESNVMNVLNETRIPELHEASTLFLNSPLAPSKEEQPCAQPPRRRCADHISTPSSSKRQRRSVTPELPPQEPTLPTPVRESRKFSPTAAEFNERNMSAQQRKRSNKMQIELLVEKIHANPLLARGNWARADIKLLWYQLALKLNAKGCARDVAGWQHESWVELGEAQPAVQLGAALAAVERIELQRLDPDQATQEMNGRGLREAIMELARAIQVAGQGIAAVIRNSPITFVSKMQWKYRGISLCGIKPPQDFKPKCENGDVDVNFKISNQYIHRMLNRWGDATSQLTAIRSTQDPKMQRSPLFEGLEVDLVKLFLTVQTENGIEACQNNSEKWQVVAKKMKLYCRGRANTKLENIYLKYLLGYNTLTSEERERVRSEVNQCWSQREVKCVRRAQQPLWRQEAMRIGAPLEDLNQGSHLEKVCAEAEECVTPGRYTNYNSFQKLAQQVQETYFPEKPTPSPEEVERQYWDIVISADAHVCVHAASVDAAEHKLGFADDVYANHPWNLKRLRLSSKNLLSYLGPSLGVSSTSIHYGMMFSTSCWHMDPTNVPWIEYLHHGAPKIWYSISADQERMFRAAAEALYPFAVLNKAIWLPCDIIMIPPVLLSQYGITVERHVQYPGEFVVVYPNTYCACIDTGLTVSEGVYFAPHNWLMDIEKIFLNLRNSCEPSLFSMEKLLIAMAQNKDTPTNLLQRVHTVLNSMLYDEISYRQDLADRNVELMTPEVFLEQNQRATRSSWQIQTTGECTYCRRHLHLTRVVGLTEGQTGLCSMHGVHLFDAAMSREKQLTNVYCILLIDNDEIYTIITKLKKRMISLIDSSK